MAASLAARPASNRIIYHLPGFPPVLMDRCVAHPCEMNLDEISFCQLDRVVIPISGRAILLGRSIAGRLISMYEQIDFNSRRWERQVPLTLQLSIKTRTQTNEIAEENKVRISKKGKKKRGVGNITNRSALMSKRLVYIILEM